MEGEGACAAQHASIMQHCSHLNSLSAETCRCGRLTCWSSICLRDRVQHCLRGSTLSRQGARTVALLIQYAKMNFARCAVAYSGCLGPISRGTLPAPGLGMSHLKWVADALRYSPHDSL
jgi:hypothetical protein